MKKERLNDVIDLGMKIITITICSNSTPDDFKHCIYVGTGGENCEEVKILLPKKVAKLLNKAEKAMEDGAFSPFRLFVTEAILQASMKHAGKAVEQAEAGNLDEIIETMDFHKVKTTMQ